MLDSESNFQTRRDRPPTYLSLAVDSRPLAENIFSANDYTSLQIYSLEHRSIFSITEFFSFGENYLYVKIKSSCWPDGRKISGAECVAGLLRVAEEFTFLKKTILRYVTRFTFSTNEFRIFFSVKIFGFEEILLLPNWRPFLPGKFSGDYKVESRKDGWRLFRLPCHEPVGEIHLVSGPSESESLFSDSIIDFTCDTAYYLGKKNACLHENDSGLFGHLVFLQEAENKNYVESLLTDLNGIEFPSDITSTYQPIEVSPAATQKRRRGPLTLMYDDFYPNEYICGVVKNHLERNGWNVKLKRDDFYNPSYSGDIKFIITRNIINSGLFGTYSLLAYPLSPPRLQSIKDYVKNREASGIGVGDWMTTLAKWGLSYPLFNIPSRYKCVGFRENPLTRDLILNNYDLDKKKR